jgi:plastocyanin
VGREYHFDPSTVVVVGAGREVRLRFANEGSLAHNLRVLSGDRDLGGTPTFQGGARSATLELAPGNYRMICTVGNHAELGMKGSLRVRARN